PPYFATASIPRSSAPPTGTPHLDLRCDVRSKPRVRVGSATHFDRRATRTWSSKTEAEDRSTAETIRTWSSEAEGRSTAEAEPARARPAECGPGRGPGLRETRVSGNASDPARNRCTMTGAPHCRFAWSHGAPAGTPGRTPAASRPGRRVDGRGGRPAHARARTAARTRSGSSGTWRTRAPVAAKMALLSAGATVVVPGSPRPVGYSVDGTMWISTSGTSSILSTW